MLDRHLPVRPDLEQLRHQAKDLRKAIRNGDREALAALERHHSRRRVEPGAIGLADAQLVLARSYGLPSWSRLVLACRLIDAIWRDDRDAVRSLVVRNPALLREDARGGNGNWGPPMSYAANLGRDDIVGLLHDLGADDVQLAFDRACLRGEIDTARKLLERGARPLPGSAMGPAETQNGAGLALLHQLGAALTDEHGDRLAPVAMVLETYCRNPRGKHECLEILASSGVDLPDTPPMAVHRGRLDLLEAHLDRDAGLFVRAFCHEDIYPPELGCHADHSLALHGTPLAGASLLHLCVDNDELELARWMIERGAEVDVRARMDEDGFGGHTALFGCVVSQTYQVGLRTDDGFARLLLDNGADTGVRASLRKRLRFAQDESIHEYRDVDVVEWGERFHDRAWVNDAAARLIAEHAATS